MAKAEIFFIYFCPPSEDGGYLKLIEIASPNNWDDFTCHVLVPSVLGKQLQHKVHKGKTHKVRKGKRKASFSQGRRGAKKTPLNIDSQRVSIDAFSLSIIPKRLNI
ncbi:MAG: hypothetical protein KF721_00670 [Ignavibacteriaceae bacterium]|nr:hypothetical protein [Ignavibacteriaceae bacterium]